MGFDDAVSVDEKMGSASSPHYTGGTARSGQNWHVYLAVLLVAGAVYIGCIVSPPSLMDDVDAVQAQIARNMLSSGDWVTARLDGVAYLEKAPLDLLDHRDQLQSFRSARLGCAYSDCALGDWRWRC